MKFYDQVDEAFLVRAMDSEPNDVIGNREGVCFPVTRTMHVCPLYGRYDRIASTKTRLFTIK